jgi:hypothetical protein
MNQVATFHGVWKRNDENIFEGMCKYRIMDWVKDVLVPGTSKNLMDAGEPETNLGEMLCLLGLYGLMATNVGFSATT